MSVFAKPATSFAVSDLECEWNAEQGISSIFSKFLTELEGFFQAGMFLYSTLICAVSCPVLIAVRCLILLLCKAWAVLFFWCVCLNSSKHFSVNFCPLISGSLLLNCEVFHPCLSKASALMLGYARFSKLHSMLCLEGKMRISFLFVALLTPCLLRNLLTCLLKNLLDY